MMILMNSKLSSLFIKSSITNTLSKSLEHETKQGKGTMSTIWTVYRLSNDGRTWDVEFVRVDDQGLIREDGDTGSPIAECSEIEAVILGKKTPELNANSTSAKKSHELFFSIVISGGVTVNFEASSVEQRSQITTELIDRIAEDEVSQLAQNQIHDLGSEDTFIIRFQAEKSVNHSENQSNAEPEEERDAERDDQSEREFTLSPTESAEFDDDVHPQAQPQALQQALPQALPNRTNVRTVRSPEKSRKQSVESSGRRVSRRQSQKPQEAQEQGEEKDEEKWVDEIEKTRKQLKSAGSESLRAKEMASKEKEEVRISERVAAQENTPSRKCQVHLVVDTEWMMGRYYLAYGL